MEYNKDKKWIEPVDNELTRKEKKVIALRLRQGLESRLAAIEAPRLCDIGGGDGTIVHKLAPFFSEVVVVEQNPLSMDKICEINQDVPNLKVVETNFLRYVPAKKFSVALLSHVLFLTPRTERDEFLRKAIDVLKPGGWLIVVLNSITSRSGNHVHFREFMETRNNIIRDTQDTVEKRLKQWGYSVEVEKVEILHQAQSPEAIANLISLVLRSVDRLQRRKIFDYIETYLQKPYGYEFYSDQEILWVPIPVL